MLAASCDEGTGRRVTEIAREARDADRHHSGLLRFVCGGVHRFDVSRGE